MDLFLHYLSLPYLLKGIGFTLAVTGLGLAGGLVVGVVLASMQLSRFSLLAAAARGYSIIFRGTPLILQMVFAYNVLPLIGIKLTAIAAGGLALSVAKRALSPVSSRCSNPGPSAIISSGTRQRCTALKRHVMTLGSPSFQPLDQGLAKLHLQGFKSATPVNSFKRFLRIPNGFGRLLS